jgi:hypothetical protein
MGTACLSADTIISYSFSPPPNIPQNLKLSAQYRVRQTKKAEEDATFYLIKYETFFLLFYLTNPAQAEERLLSARGSFEKIFKLR